MNWIRASAFKLHSINNESMYRSIRRPSVVAARSLIVEYVVHSGGGGQQAATNQLQELTRAKFSVA